MGRYWACWQCKKNDYEQFTRLNIPYESISAPTLIIHGDEDSNVNIEHAEFAKEKIKGSSLYIVKEGDHMMSATHAEEIEYQIEGLSETHYSMVSMLSLIQNRFIPDSRVHATSGTK